MTMMMKTCRTYLQALQQALHHHSPRTHHHQPLSQPDRQTQSQAMPTSHTTSSYSSNRSKEFEIWTPIRIVWEDEDIDLDSVVINNIYDPSNETKNRPFYDHPILLNLQELLKMISQAYSDIQPVSFKTSKTRKRLSMEDLQIDWSSNDVKCHFYYQYYNKHFSMTLYINKGSTPLAQFKLKFFKKLQGAKIFIDNHTNQLQALSSTLL